MFHFCFDQDQAMHEYDTYCACGFHGHGNGRKPARCPACGRAW